MPIVASSWVVLAALLAAAAGADEEPVVLTLEQAIAIALRDNPTVAAAAAEAAAAAAGTDAARASLRPRVEVTAGFQRTTHPVEVFGSLLSQGRFTAENFALDLLNDPPPLSTVEERLAVSQPLWAGGSLRAARDAAKGRWDAAAAIERRRRQEVVLLVVDRYTAAVLALEERGALADSLAAAEAHVRLAEDRFAAGEVVESDVLRARLRHSELEGRLAEAAAAVEVTRAALNLELGRPPATPVTLAAQIEPPPPRQEGLPELVERGLARRPDLAAARAAVEAARLEVDAAAGERWPQLAWNGAYERAAPRPFAAAGDSWSLGVGVRWSGFDGGAARARRRQAEAALTAAEERLRRLEGEVAVEIERAFHAVAVAGVGERTAGSSITLARRSLEIVEDRYREGWTTVVELLDAEAAVAASRRRALGARRERKLADVALSLAVGELGAEGVEEAP